MASMRRRSTLAALLALSAALAWPQAQNAGRRVMLYFGATPPGSLPREDLVFLYATLLTRLQRASVAVVEPDAVAVPASGEERAAKATARGADAWVAVSVSREGDGLRASVTGVDLRSGGALAAEAFNLPSLSGADVVPWDDVAAAVAAAFPPKQPQRPAASAGEVAVEALAGTQVEGLTASPIRVGPDGTGRVSVVRPGFYRVEAQRDGELPAREDLYLSVDDDTVRLVQAPAPRWLFEGYTLNLSYLGGSVGRVLGPFYARVGLTTYIIAPWLRNEGEDETAANLPLTEIVAAIGFAPLGGDAAVRPYVDGSAEARLMHTAHVFALDPVAPFAFRAAAGVEIRGASRARLFADYGPVVYDVHGADPTTVEATITVDGERGGGYFYKPWWGGVLGGVLIDLVAFRVGLRWYL
jgi:hypothetical protein